MESGDAPSRQRYACQTRYTQSGSGRLPSPRTATTAGVEIKCTSGVTTLVRRAASWSRRGSHRLLTRDFPRRLEALTCNYAIVREQHDARLGKSLKRRVAPVRQRV